MLDSLLEILLPLLLASLAAVAVFGRIKVPSPLAYVVVGIVLGPGGIALVAHSQDVHFLSELGVAFLLFTVGLDFPVAELKRLRSAVFGLGGAQMITGTLLIAALGWALGLPPMAALVVGGALAMSSTAVVTRELTDRMALKTPHGRLSVAVLLFQDLAVVPFLILIPAFGQGEPNPTGLLLLVAQGAGILFGLLALGRWIWRPLLREVAKARSRELFTLTALSASLTAAWFTHWAGLSFALGAFMAGMVLAETDFRHQIETDIRPFRDVLLGLFFVMIGLMIDVGATLSLAPWIVLAVFCLLALKTLVTAGLCHLFRTNRGTALGVALSLSEAGEFGLTLVALALQNRLFSPDTAQFLFASVVTSMALGPFLVAWGIRLATAPSPLKSGAKPWPDGGAPSNHVILCGYAHTGRELARVLKRNGIAHVVIDMHPTRIAAARQQCLPVIYGDAGNPAILEAAGLERCQAIITTWGDPAAAERLIEVARGQRSDVAIIARAPDETGVERLLGAGADKVLGDSLVIGPALAEELLGLLEAPCQAAMNPADPAGEGATG